MNYVLDSSSHLPFVARSSRIDTHTHSHRDATDNPIPLFGYCRHENNISSSSLFFVSVIHQQQTSNDGAGRWTISILHVLYHVSYSRSTTVRSIFYRYGNLPARWDHQTEVTFLPLSQLIKAGTRFSDLWGMQGWVDLVDWLHVLFCSVLQPSSIWTYFLHLSMSSADLIDSSMVSPVHVLMLSIQAVRGLPRLCASKIVFCIIVFFRATPLWLFHTFFSDAPIASPLFNLIRNSIVHWPLSVTMDPTYGNVFTCSSCLFWMRAHSQYPAPDC